MKRYVGVTLLCCAALGCNADSTEPGDKGGDKGGSEVTLDGLTSRTPSTWKKGNPASKMRSYQFALPKADGDPEDAELVIFFFGKGNGGSAEDNIKRWKGFFRAPEGKTLDDVSKVTKFKVGDVDITYLDVAGTFLSKDPPFDPNAKEVKKADFRRFGVIFESPNGPYFITLTGPAKTLERHKKDFDDWLKNFK